MGSIWNSVWLHSALLHDLDIDYCMHLVFRSRYEMKEQHSASAVSSQYHHKWSYPFTNTRTVIVLLHRHASCRYKAFRNILTDLTIFIVEVPHPKNSINNVQWHHIIIMTLHQINWCPRHFRKYQFQARSHVRMYRYKVKMETIQMTKHSDEFLNR